MTLTWLGHLQDGETAAVSGDGDGSTLSAEGADDGNWLMYTSATRLTLQRLEALVLARLPHSLNSGYIRISRPAIHRCASMTGTPDIRTDPPTRFSASNELLGALQKKGRLGETNPA